MSDVPILFSEPMVRALLDGRKTMTRRLAWKFPRAWGDSRPMVYSTRDLDPSPWQRVEPHDRLWVRERFHVRPIASAMHAYSYFDDADPKFAGGWSHMRLLPYDHIVKHPERAKWIPSIHMPRSLSRLTLVVEAVRIERLAAISEVDAQAEGIAYDFNRDPIGPCKWASAIDERRGWNSARAAFTELWSSLHGADSFDENPEVVALTFTVHKHNIDKLEAA